MTEKLDFQTLQLKKVAAVDGGEYAGPCPFCGGKDRFRAWPEAEYPHYWCRHCGARGPLGSQSGADPVRQVRTDHVPAPVPSQSWLALTSEHWQHKADQFTTHCWVALRDYHTDVLDWLRSERGLSDALIDDGELGYNPADCEDVWGGVKVWLPRGLVIPHIHNGTYWRVRIRTGPSAYRQPKGCANNLYRGYRLHPGCTAVLVESELDALVIESHCGELLKRGLTPVATGGTQNAHLMRWIASLAMARRVLVAFDADEAGDSASDWWLRTLGNKAIRLRPTQHDITDMVKAGESVEQWIRGAA